MVGSTGAARLWAGRADPRGEGGAAPPVPETVGPYRILGILGEGGMGVVYRARQEAPIRREVALKVIAVGRGSADVAARFDAERRTLALLDHPNIATVLDAGSDSDGQPYFVMELVRGVPITEYVRSAGLASRETIRLVLSLVRAIAYAHRRGVIHRDLKPSNVFVTRGPDGPLPKVIDFGVAKATEEPVLATSFRTRAGQVVGTLEYMSPEQARGDVAAVDTRSDVYSLGVLLYELLTGMLPVEVGDVPLHEAVQRIAEQLPPSLRSASKPGTTRLDPDLETITAKCLEKDPDRRYGGAGELAEDLERFLAAQPIQARPASAMYQLRMAVRRNRVAVSFVGLAFLFLLVITITVSVQLGLQRTERARAEAQARRAERISEFMTGMIKAPTPDVDGRDVKVVDVLDGALADLRTTLGEDPEVDVEILETIAESYQFLAQGILAEEVRRQALELRLARLPHDRVGIVRARLGIAATLFYQDRYAEAESIAVEVLEELEEVPAAGHRLRGDAYNTLGITVQRLGRLDESVAALETAIREYEELPPEEFGEAANSTLDNLAGTMFQLGDIERSEELVRRALAMRQENGSSRLAIATGLYNLTVILRRQGEYSEALPLQLEALALERELDRPIDIAMTLEGLGETYRELGRIDEAKEALREAIVIREGEADSSPEALEAARSMLADLGDGNE